jgi:hypothetical protein
MKTKTFPPGWDEERVRSVLAHYEAQTEDEAAAEDEAAFEDASQTVIEIPNELVPLVRELIAKYQHNLLDVPVRTSYTGMERQSEMPCRFIVPQTRTANARPG